MKSKCLLLVIIIVGILTIQSCISTAQLSDFSKTSKSYNFSNISNSRKSANEKSYNFKTGFEYYIRTANNVDSASIVSSIVGCLQNNGYSIKVMDTKNGAIIGKRGLRANEWNSIIGVYYQTGEEGYQIYIKNKITQDFTGGWREDRAKKIGETICCKLNNCKESYTVDTESENTIITRLL